LREGDKLVEDAVAAVGLDGPALARGIALGGGRVGVGLEFVVVVDEE
jgi:hypothetical protein